MAHSSEHRFASPGFVRCILVLVFMFLLAIVLWHTGEKSHYQPSCPSCDCDCDSDNIFSIQLDLLNNSYSECGKNDPEMNEEMEKDTVSLLSEELSLQKNVTDDNLGRTRALIMEAKRTSRHYQKEAEKCNAGVETCEEARERAEAALVEERKLSELWEKRAREYGWKEEGTS
ncbi:hypothetical protein NMG60_11020696 [Bertholletia excelsa]